MASLERVVYGLSNLGDTEVRLYQGCGKRVQAKDGQFHLSDDVLNLSLRDVRKITERLEGLRLWINSRDRQDRGAR